MKASTVLIAAAHSTATVWNRYEMTAHTVRFIDQVQTELTEFGYDVTLYTLSAVQFVWWFLNESTWSKEQTTTPEVNTTPCTPAPSENYDNLPTVEEMFIQFDNMMTEALAVGSERIEHAIAGNARREQELQVLVKKSELPKHTSPSMDWSKPDLVSACRCYGLKTTGNKAQLLERLHNRLGVAVQ